MPNRNSAQAGRLCYGRRQTALARMAPRPHRACLGGAGFLHQRGNAERCPPPPSLSRWSGGLGTRNGRAGNRPAGAEACAPPGRARWGRDAGSSRCWCRSQRSTGASPVGAERGDHCLLVQKPTLHRGEPGGGGAPSGLERFAFVCGGKLQTCRHSRSTRSRTSSSGATLTFWCR